MLQYYINWLGKSWSLLQLYPGQIHKLAAFYLCKVKTTTLMVFPKTTSKTSKSCSKVNLIILLLDFLCNFTKTQLLKFFPYFLHIFIPNNLHKLLKYSIILFSVLLYLCFLQKLLLHFKSFLFGKKLNMKIILNSLFDI